MKKINLTKSITLLLFLFIIIIFSASNASAGFLSYTVGSSGSSVLKDIFGLDETPFLYMQLPKAGSNYSGTYWYAPEGTDYFADQGPDTQTERWLSLANWNSVKTGGEWRINSNVFYGDGSTDVSNTSFTVTPEPAAVLLFLAGGTPIALNLIKRRKQLV